MQDDEAILTEQGVRDLRRAIWWCKREWFCLALGALLALVALIPLVLVWRNIPIDTLSSATNVAGFSLLAIFMTGLVTGMVGYFLSLPSSLFALLGILFPGKSGRTRFALLFLVSALPFVIGQLLITKCWPIPDDSYITTEDSEQTSGGDGLKPAPQK